MKFQKGKLYMLRGIAKNKRYDCMIDYNGHLYINESSPKVGNGWSSKLPRFYDGDVFLCLEDAPEFDCDAFIATLNPNTLEYDQLRRTARAKGSYDQHQTVMMLTPAGGRAELKVKGNKTKFREVKSNKRSKKQSA